MPIGPNEDGAELYRKHLESLPCPTCGAKESDFFDVKMTIKEMSDAIMAASTRYIYRFPPTPHTLGQTWEGAYYEALAANSLLSDQVADLREAVEVLRPPAQKYNDYRVKSEKLEAEASALRVAVLLAIESQGWDGNNPDDDRWINLYATLRRAALGVK